ncbi:MAG: glycosyltransferase, partial [Patescibacteria group bacterium]|nr:glycosyltransferase [Patescibacteria group bacterium]
MRKIKVLFLLTKSDVGGAQKYVRDLAGHLDRDRYEARMLYGGTDIRWLSNRVWPWALFLNDWLAIAELVRTFRREQPDVIHLNSSKAGVLGALAAFIYRIRYQASGTTTRSVKVVFTAHGWVFNPTNHLAAPVRWAYIALHAFAALFQDAIICVSEYDLALAVRYRIAPASKLTTIHNGIDPKITFLDRTAARDKLRYALSAAEGNLNARRPWIGSVGRLVKEKNYETYIQAASRIAAAFVHHKTEEQPLFFLIGEG